MDSCDRGRVPGVKYSGEESNWERLAEAADVSLLRCLSHFKITSSVDEVEDRVLL